VAKLTRWRAKQEGQKYGYDTEAFAIYDTMKYVNPAIHTVAVGLYTLRIPVDP
jgi:hypothetical protein